MGFDPYYPIPSRDEPALDVFLRLEPEHIAVAGYSNLNKNNRRRQIALYRVLQYSKNTHFDAFIPYLAMNYFDRFISRNGLPVMEDNWINDTDILATSCLTLACKLRDDHFNLSNFLNEKQLSGKINAIQQIELRVVQVLDWQMESITALCFAPLLVDVCQPPRGLKQSTVCQIILETQDDIRLTAFKPSIISASAILAALSYIYDKQYQAFECRILSLWDIDKVELSQCVELVKETCEKKQLWMETSEKDRTGQPLLRVQAGNPRQQPEQDRDIDFNRISEIQEVEETPTMDFELKWKIEDEVEILLNPPLGPYASYCLGLLSCSNTDGRPCTLL